MAKRKIDDQIQYVRDTLDLIMSLYAVNPDDPSETIKRTLLQGKDEYFDLVFRRLAVDFYPKDVAIVLWMLDIIQARLASLERKRHQKTPKPKVDTAVPS